MIHRTIATLISSLLLTSLASSGHAADAGTKIVIGHDAWIGYSGVFIAKEKGFFSKAGLDVELKPFSNPGDTLPALVAGGLDVGLTTLQNLALLDGKSDAALSTVYLIDSSNGADALISKKEITSVAQLKGKKVGATIGEVNHLLLLTALQKAGMKESDVELTNLSADDAGAAFVAGKLDAAATWEPWVTKALTNGGNVIFSSKDIPDTILDCVVVPKGKLDAHPERVKALLSAIDQGVKFLRDNPAESNEIIAKYLSVKPEEVPPMLKADKIYNLADNARLLSPGGAGFASMDKVISFVTGEKLVDKALDPKALIIDQFVKP